MTACFEQSMHDKPPTSNPSHRERGSHVSLSLAIHHTSEGTHITYDHILTSRTRHGHREDHAETPNTLRCQAKSYATSVESRLVTPDALSISGTVILTAHASGHHHLLSSRLVSSRLPLSPDTLEPPRGKPRTSIESSLIQAPVPAVDVDDDTPVTSLEASGTAHRR